MIDAALKGVMETHNSKVIAMGERHFPGVRWHRTRSERKILTLKSSIP
jgi:hypothetical protein